MNNRRMEQTPDVWLPGKLLNGKYTVVQRIGQGGMGTVYHVQRRTFRGEVLNFAVKIIRPKIFGNEERQEMFLRELKNWINLPEHPNLSRCLFFQTIEAHLAIFSEFIDGGSMVDWMSAGSLRSRKAAWDIAIQSARGLAAAHACGVLHLDVKPPNLLISSDRILKITDFGLSRVLAENDMLADSLVGSTSHGMTPGFASPEQTMGQELNHWSDQWSWAVTMLYGFTGVMNWKLGALAHKAFHKAILKKDASSIPEPIISILETCFQEKPDDRWTSMLDIAHELEFQYNAFFGETYDREEAVYQIPKPQEEPAGIPDADLSQSVFLLLESWRDQFPDDYKECFRDLPVRRGTAQSRHLRDLVVGNRADSFLKDAIALKGLSVHKDRIALQLIKSDIYKYLEDYQGALNCFKEAWDLFLLWEGCVAAEESLATSLATGIEVLGKWGSILLLNKQYDVALEIFKKANDLYDQLHQSCSTDCCRLDYAWTKLNTAVALGRLGRFEDSVVSAQTAISVLSDSENANENEDSLRFLAGAYANLAASLGYLDKDAEAAEKFEKSVEIVKKLVDEYGKEDLRYRLVQTLLNTSNAYLNCGALEKAEEICREAINQLDSMSPSTMSAVIDARIEATTIIIRLLYEKGKYPKALKKMDQLINAVEYETYFRGRIHSLKKLAILMDMRLAILEKLPLEQEVTQTTLWKTCVIDEIQRRDAGI